jgi:hypothetical protein
MTGRSALVRVPVRPAGEVQAFSSREYLKGRDLPIEVLFLRRLQRIQTERRHIRFEDAVAERLEVHYTCASHEARRLAGKGANDERSRCRAGVVRRQSERPRQRIETTANLDYCPSGKVVCGAATTHFVPCPLQRGKRRGAGSDRRIFALWGDR